MDHCEANRERIHCDESPGAGPRVGSNAVEADCETVVQERCNRSGMYWTVDVANPILTLR